jgi:hypothetical protein
MQDRRAPMAPRGEIQVATRDGVVCVGRQRELEATTNSTTGGLVGVAAALGHFGARLPKVFGLDTKLQHLETSPPGASRSTATAHLPIPPLQPTMVPKPQNVTVQSVTHRPLPPLPKLRVRRPNKPETNPCLGIMSSVLGT